MLSDDDFVRLFQRAFSLKEDGWAGRDTEAKLRELAREHGATIQTWPDAVPDDYWPMLSRIESNDRLYAKARSSSASGLYQFIKSTWIGEDGSWGDNPNLAFGGLKPSAEEQLDRVKSLTFKNAGTLKASGVPVNRATLYAAHFFGVTTAMKVIMADINASAEALAGPAATKANPSILKGKTVGQFLSWLHKKTGEWAR